MLAVALGSVLGALMDPFLWIFALIVGVTNKTVFIPLWGIVYGLVSVTLVQVLDQQSGVEVAYSISPTRVAFVSIAFAIVAGVARIERFSRQSMLDRDPPAG
jgi:hypothetical protein